MTLPDASKREALFKHLLELNAQGLANAAFGLVNERVVAVITAKYVGFVLSVAPMLPVS